MKTSLILSFLIIFSIQTGLCQHTRSGDDQLIPLTEAIERISRDHSISIIFNPGWFIHDSVPSSVTLIPVLRDALHAVFSATGYEAAMVEDRVIVVPKKQIDMVAGGREKEVVLVGDPALRFRYRRATISGMVTDLNTGETLAGALVYVEALGQGVSTDEQGAYRIELPTGKHTLSVSYVGYSPYHVNVELVSDGRLDHALAEESRLLDMVTVTARRLDANVTETQMSVIRLDAVDLRMLPTSLGERDIIRGVTLLPGVQTVGEFGTGFHVRGGSADQNLILLEGVPLFNSSHLFGLTSMVNPDLVTDVTLIKAGIPARYGERSASVMEIRLGVEDPDTFAIRGGIGMLSSRLSMQFPLPLEQGYVLLGGRTSYSNLMLSRIPDEALMNSAASFHDFSGLIHAPISRRSSLSLFGYRSNDGFAFNEDTDYMYGSLLGGLKWNGILTGRLFSAVSVAHSSYRYGVTSNNPQNPNNAFEMVSDIGYNSLKAQLSWFRRPGQSIEGGMNLISYRISPGNLVPHGNASTVDPMAVSGEQAIEAAWFLSADLALGPHLIAEAGLRYTQYVQLGPGTKRIYEPGASINVFSMIDSVAYRRNELMTFYHGLEPRFSVRYQTSRYTSLKMSLSRIRQHLNLVSNTAVPTPADVWQLSNTYHPPMTSDQIAAGIFRNFLNNQVETSAELYVKRFRFIAEPRNNATILLNPELETALVNAHGSSYGLELYAKKGSGPFNGWVSYTYSQSRRRTDSQHPDEQINRNKWYYADFDKPHNLVLNANLQISKHFRLGGTFNYSTGRPVTLPEWRYVHGDRLLVYFSDRNAYRLPDYHRLDLSLSFEGAQRRRRHWRSYWTFSVVNVYGRRNIYSTFFEKTNPAPSNNYQFYTQYKLYVIGRPLPTLTYNFSF